MWEILLNFVLNGWLKWAVILTDCNWVVVNSIRIRQWVVHYYKSQMGYMFCAKDVMLTCGPTKLTCPLK